MLTRWDPFADMSRFESELFRNARGASPARAATRPARAFAPPVDVYEDADSLVLLAELPGLRLEDVTLDVENDILTMSGERKPEREEGHHVRERAHGAFARSFQLPRTIDVSKIEATLKDGILTVRLPKRDGVKARKIEVKS